MAYILQIISTENYVGKLGGERSIEAGGYLSWGVKSELRG